MTRTGTAIAIGERTSPRILGTVDSGRPGPTFLAQGGIHGNEPAGVAALERVLATISERKLTIAGRIVACRGNLLALHGARRYVERDLNRQWLPESIARLRAKEPRDDRAEDKEQRELLALYEQCWDARRGPLVFLDLHTSSAPGSPFSCMADTLPNRRITDALPIPMILGLEECIDGAVMEWFNQRGQIAIAVEGGQHDAPATIDNLESAVWLTLAASGVVARQDVDIAFHEARLREATNGTPHVVEVTWRHAITPLDRFAMVPGYVSFQPVEKGDLLGHDRNGPVRARARGMVLLPLYQGLGEDGYFFARVVPRFWFRLSGLLRRFRLSRFVGILPGVRRDPADRRTLLVNPTVARWLTVPLFHLFGYRRERPRGDRLAFSRRWAAPDARTVRPR
ncbi:MAG: succinylglutamate desuccinylase/aspartoacylase family protein [Planctomycetes bacterium]|nr:succinylglutamate desuccinylase/aspartoacylase family protein [Planctomycetota bacterium]